ncbi:MAG TPA: OFA family MFS transporter [Selenomonadales bacterium]|nr:OFA family MFS transporter [Selenomonadales bacterium]
MKNRWLIAASAVGIHICIGSVYAWSVLTKPIMNELGLGLKETQWTFSLAILFLGLSAAFLGSHVEKYGPRKSGLFAAACFCTGMFGTGLAVFLKSLPLIYLFYGVIGGIGLGTGYITPVSTLVKWFPKKRGFATGIAIMGFGFASMIAGPLFQMLIEQYGLVASFEIMGLAYLMIMVPSALYLAPPEDVQELVAASGACCPLTGATQLTSTQALKTWQFYTLWWMLFTNITCGIGLLSVASPMAQETVRMSPLAAAAMVGVIGLINGCGRLFWAAASDYLGRANTYIAFFVIQIFAFFLLAKTTESTLFQLLIYLIISCYGGGFATIPAFLSDLFGTRDLSAIHGKILTAWAAAGVAGPLLVAWVREATHSYNGTLIVFSGWFVLSLFVALVLRAKQQPATAAGQVAYFPK